MTEEVRELFETPRRRNCERKSKYFKRLMLGTVSFVGIVCSWNSMTEIIRKLVETSWRMNC